MPAFLQNESSSIPCATPPGRCFFIGLSASEASLVLIAEEPSRLPQPRLHPVTTLIFPMKPATLLLLSLLATTAARAAEATAYKPESQAVSEIFTTKVVKVFSATEGSHSFQAYVITWKEHEVVVIPPPYRDMAPLKVGDTVRCEMRQSHPGSGAGDARVMTFEIVPHRPTAVDEAARLERVAAEVTRRRMLREAIGTEKGPGPKAAAKSPEPAPTTGTPPTEPPARRP
jgi:hypothetical protein